VLKVSTVQQQQSERTDNYKKKPSGSPKGKGKPKKRRHAVTTWRFLFDDALLLVMCVGKKGFVSLSMKFQASRFSASGRKMPLEPRRSEACRSCQPMHVLSFVEGRKWFVFWY